MSASTPSRGSSLGKRAIALDLTNPTVIYLKGFLFLLGGILASTVILLEHPSVRIALSLVLAVWCFARFYYFAFYVIEHYVDPGYRFAGLGSFVAYLLRGRDGATSDRRNPPDPKAK